MKASDIPVVAGWKLLPDYAEPATAGGGYVEVQENGDFEVAYEADGSMREMGVDSFLLTLVPIEVIRKLLAAWDASARVAPSRLVREAELAHMREGCRLLRISRDVGYVSDADWAKYNSWLDADDPDATEYRLQSGDA